MKSFYGFAIFLLICGFFSSIFTIIKNYDSLTTLSTRQISVSCKNCEKAINKNNIILIVIESKFNYLGTVYINFDQKEVINDRIIFRIKEINSNKWYYENVYTTEQFYLNNIFPFGFKPIKDSQGKKYVIELISQNYKGEKIFISTHEGKTTIKTVHQFNLKDLFLNPNEIVYFTIIKIYEIFSQINILTSTFLYLLPFFGYLIFLLFAKSKNVYCIKCYKILNFVIPKKILISHYMIIGLIVLDINLINSTNKLLSIFIFLALFVMGLFLRFEINLILRWGILFMASSYIFLLIKNPDAEKVANYGFALIFIAILIKLNSKYLDKSIKLFRFIFKKFGSNIIIVTLNSFLVSFFVRKIKSKNIEFNRLKKYLYFTFLIIILSIIFVVTNYYNDKLSRQNTVPVIVFIEPKIVYPSTKIKITGHNFGSIGDKNSKIFSQKGEIQIDFWSNEKIIFTVPLHLDKIEQKIWIEKTIFQNGIEKRVASNKVSIKILPVLNKFTIDDDAYFQQLPLLSKEVRELNGYNYEVSKKDIVMSYIYKLSSDFFK